MHFQILSTPDAKTVPGLLSSTFGLPEGQAQVLDALGVFL